ncbi:MAG: hypothetical protein Kow0058_18420 [Roseovarius sp.]
MVLALAGAAALVPMPAARAETLRSQSLEAELSRHPLSLRARSGATIAAEQVRVVLRRRDGRPIGPEMLRAYAGFAERAACGRRPALATLMVGAEGGAGHFDVLCPAAP